MTAYLFSCSRATCAVPEAQRELFKGAEELVTSAKGWEPGALNLAQAFAMKFRTPLVHSEITHLVVDVEQTGDALWSKYSLKIPDSSRSRIAERHADHYRSTLRNRIDEDLKRHSTLVHVLVHTHPDLPGAIQLSAHPLNVAGRSLADLWAEALAKPELTVTSATMDHPKPYAEAFVREFAATQYAQVRLSVSQSFFLDGKPLRWDVLKKHLMSSLENAVAAHE